MRLNQTCPLLALVLLCGVFYTWKESGWTIDTASAPAVTQESGREAQEAADGTDGDSREEQAPAEDETSAAEEEPAAEEEAETEEEPAIVRADTSLVVRSPGETEDEAAQEVPVRYHFAEVDESYFDDALFIGDSRTVGLYEYCETLSERADFFAKISLTVNNSLDKPFIKTDDGKKSAEELLSDGRQYGKIYIMLGLNEIGGGTAASFGEDYRVMIERIREMQPDALIVIQSILHVTGHKNDNDRYFNNARINARNAVLQTLADEEARIWYLDINETFDDEKGNLASSYSFDDVHLKAASYVLWYDHLAKNGLVAGEESDVSGNDL